MAIEIQETYSSPIVNYVESAIINGVEYTRFFTELNTDLTIGEYVYILNGNYDNSDLIDDNEYQKGSNGYKILEIDKNSIVLEIPYRNEDAWNEDLLEDYTKVYLVDNLNKFNYENVDNSFAFSLYAGEKYSTLNNNIFLSQIENIPYTVETQTKDKFFKSYANNDPILEMINSRGQLFNDSTSLNFDMDEISLYGLTGSIDDRGLSGSAYLTFSIGKNYVKDFDFKTNDSQDKIVALISEGLTYSSNLWIYDKQNLDILEVELRNSEDDSVDNTHYIKPLHADWNNVFPSKVDIQIILPNHVVGTFSYKDLSGPGVTMSIERSNPGSSPLRYNTDAFSETILTGYSDVGSQSNYKSFGFFDISDREEIPSPDNTKIIGSSSIALGYSSGTYSTPYFVLSGTQGNNGLTYSYDETYFPVMITDDQINVVPDYARYTGIGSAVRSVINEWENTDESSFNMEIAFAGESTLTAGEEGEVGLQGGIYFYSYTGNYRRKLDTTNWLGNAFEFSRSLFDKYMPGGQWEDIDIQWNPFINIGITDWDNFRTIKDIQWLGTEKKELGMGIRTEDNDKNIIEDPDSTEGIWYSKYLIVTEVDQYYIYLNFDGYLLEHNTRFKDAVDIEDIPQVHWVLESVPLDNGNTVMGKNRSNAGDSFPSILDSEVPLGSLEYSIEGIDWKTDGSTFGIDFGTSSITSFNFNDDRWIVSNGGNFSPRISYWGGGGYTSSTSEGIDIYEMSIGNDPVKIEITASFSFSIGNDLPSNQVFKSMGETIFDGDTTKRRVWSATPQGLFMFDYDLEYSYNYYYSIDFDNNEIPLLETLYRNNRIYVMEDFVYDGISFSKDKIYTYLKSEKRWVIDTTYLKSYIGKSHFKDGTFLTDGIYNDGIFGNRDTTALWDQGEWRNGIFYNSVWNDGKLESKSDELVSQSYYASRNGDSVNLTTDFTNNRQFGYNLAVDSSIYGGQIENGNFVECLIGSQSSVSLLDQIYKGITYSYSDITIDKGYFYKSNIESSVVNNSKIQLSSFNKSKIDIDSKILNSKGTDSIISDASIENKGKTKVIGYDKWYNIKKNITNIDVIQIHKFFINETDFNELDFNDWVIFNNIKLDNSNISNILDQLFYVLGGTYGYYQDTYEDLNKITVTGDRIEFQSNNYNVFVSKKLKTQNEEKSTISYNGSTLEVSTSTYDNPRYSIDLSIITESINYNSDSSVYLNAIENDGILKFTALDIEDSTIQTNHFKNCWINGGEWINGSMINPNQFASKFNYGTISTFINDGTQSLLFDSQEDIYEIKNSDLISSGSIININNIWGETFSTYAGGNFELISGTSSLTLEPYVSSGLTAGLIVNPPISQYVYMNLNRIDGIDNTLKISGGLFKNQSFSNTTFENNDFDLTDTNFDNIRKLMVLKSEITSRDIVDINNGFFGHGQISNDFGTSSTSTMAIGYKQVLYGVNVEGGQIYKSAFLNGTWTDGVLTNNRHNKNDDLLPINNIGYNTDKTALVSGWHAGVFNNGIIDRSVWLSGTFSNGVFKNSEFLGGNWLNGIFGNEATKSTLNLFRKGHWFSGTFENGIFGDNSSQVSDVNSIYATSSYVTNYYVKDGTNIWEDGNFNNGVFTSIDDNVSLWKNGKFNNGQIVDSVIWYDGIFNNGKFRSSYGRYVADVWGEVDLLTIASASTTTERAINLEYYYNTDLDFLNRYNIASIRDKDDGNKFNNPGTLVLDTSDNLLKYMYVSNVHNIIRDPFSDKNSSHGYTELEVSNFYDAPGSTTLNLQFKPLEFIQNNNTDRTSPIYNANVIGAKIRVQDTSNDFIYDGSQYLTASNFLGATISGTSLTYSSTYAWRDGIFNNGVFGDTQNLNNANPSWETGTLNGGKFYGKQWKSGIFIKGSFNGSGVSQSQTSVNNIYEGYDPQQTIEKYIDDFSNIVIATSSVSQIGFKTILDNYNWYGMWISGEVSANINEFDETLRVSENVLVDYFHEDKYRRRRINNANFNKMLWIDGNFNNVDGNFNESVWLSGTFSNGQFNDSMFNPYVQRWDFENNDISNIKFTFELDTNKCLWNNGVFNSGVFYYSDWNNGVFENGTMVGGKFNKGTTNYISSFESIWENGRWRNGNWYGSSFTIDNVYNNDSVPNPFEYLGEYFIGVEYPPFQTDILGNNSKRIQDDKLHIWNCLEGTQSIINYDLDANNHNFGNDTGQFTEPVPLISPSGIQTTNLILTSDVSSGGLISMTVSVDTLSSTPIGGGDYFYSPTFNFDLTDSSKLPSGSYGIEFSTNGSSWTIDSALNSLTFTLKADVFDVTNTLIQSNKIIKTIVSNASNINTTFVVPNNHEYRLKIDISGTAILPSTTFSILNFYMQMTYGVSGIKYTADNNTTNGYIGMSWSGSYLNSDIMTSSSTNIYFDQIGATQALQYCNYDYFTISVPTLYNGADGTYTQFGNGIFQRGIWENGVWNNGYRGIEFGTYIDTGSTDIYTYKLGTASVEMNSTYVDFPKAKYRTEPVIFFNKVQRSFKTSKNIWRFVLESALDIDGSGTGTNTDDYNKLIIGDKISVGNIVAIDINGNRKIIKDLFTVISIPNRNQITLQYVETFPIDDIQIDSDRHLIYITKNIWLSGAYLNGYFEGVMNSGFVKGNREVTKLIDSHLIDVRFEGGQLSGIKYGLTYSFDNKATSAEALSPLFESKYNNLYHSSLVQNMEFSDSVTLEYFTQIAPDDLTIIGNPATGTKELSFSSTSSISDNSIQYIYNSDMDLVYEPEYFSSIFDQPIYNSHVINKSKLGSTTEFQNIPCGYITYDILSSISKFKYSVDPYDINKVKEFNLSLGSKIKKFEIIIDNDFNESNNDSSSPSSFNKINSATYGIYKREYNYNDDGITFDEKKSQILHDNFMYTYPNGGPGSIGTYSLIVSDNSFTTKNRYHLVEVDVEFKENESFINPWSISNTVTFNATYSYSVNQIPKLTIGQSYNQLYGTNSGYISNYSNNFIPFIDGSKQSEINNFGSDIGRLTIKSYIYNNIGDYRDSISILEQGFNSDTGLTSGNYTINSPVYYSIRSYELDQIPFFKYQDFIDPISGTISEWNIQNTSGINQDQLRKADDRVKTPFYATSIPINYNDVDDSFILSNNIEFLGGTNIVGNSVINFEFDLSTFTFNFNNGTNSSQS